MTQNSRVKNELTAEQQHEKHAALTRLARLRELCTTRSVVLVLSLAVNQGIACGVPASLSVLIPALMRAYGATNGEAASVMSTCIGMLYITGIFGSWIIGRWSVRVTVMIGGMALSGGFMICYFAQNVHFLIISIGLISGTGCGLLVICNMVAINQQFEKGRTFVFGIIGATGGVGIPIFQQLFYQYDLNYGIAGCFLLTGAITLNTLVFGLMLKPTHESRRHRACDHVTSSSVFDIRILKSTSFMVWLICAAVASCSVDLMVIVLPDYVVEKGFTEHDGVNVASIRSIFNIVGSPVFGLLGSMLTDKLYVLCMSCFFLTGVVSFSFVYQFSIVGLLVTATFQGVMFGAVFAAGPIMTADVVGSARFNSAFGLVNTCHGIGTFSIGPIIGALFDSTGGYNVSFLLSSALLCVSGVLYTALRYFVFVNVRPRKHSNNGLH